MAHLGSARPFQRENGRFKPQYDYCIVVLSRLDDVSIKVPHLNFIKLSLGLWYISTNRPSNNECHASCTLYNVAWKPQKVVVGRGRNRNTTTLSKDVRFRPCRCLAFKSRAIRVGHIGMDYQSLVRTEQVDAENGTEHLWSSITIAIIFTTSLCRWRS
jgi:hypothetical protein